MKSVSILIANDDAMIRQCLRRALESDPRFRIYWEAIDGLQAVHLAKKHRPDIVLLDAEMPRMDAIEATHVLRSNCPEIRILVISVYDQSRIQALEAGADAFVTIDSGCEAIREAVRRVLALPTAGLCEHPVFQ